MSDPIIVASWGCLPETERRVCDLFGFPTLVPPAFILALLVDAMFELYSDWSPVKRREAWEQVFRMTRVEIDQDGELVVGYFANRQWCVDLYNCQTGGGCTIGQALCQQLAFVNVPIP